MPKEKLVFVTILVHNEVGYIPPINSDCIPDGYEDDIFETLPPKVADEYWLNYSETLLSSEKSPEQETFIQWVLTHLLKFGISIHHVYFFEITPATIRIIIEVNPCQQ